MKRKFKLVQNIEIEIPDDKVKGILESYQELVYREAEINDILEYIADQDVRGKIWKGCSLIGEKGIDFNISYEDSTVEDLG